MLDITKALAAPGTEFPFEDTAEIPAQDVFGETVRFDPATLRGVFCGLDGGVLLTGRLCTKAHGTCAMCLKPVSVPIEVSFREMFRKEAVKGDEEAFAYEGCKLDLAPLSLTLALLELPMRFMCVKDCDGGESVKAHLGETSPGGDESDSARRP